MNIEKELKKMGSNKKGLKKVVADLYEQKEELDKKIHLFNVLSFAKEIGELVHRPEFISCNIVTMNIKHCEDPGSGTNNIRFELIDSEGKIIEFDVKDKVQKKISRECMEIQFSNGFIDVNPIYISQYFKKDVWQSISLLNNTKEAILDLFLNNDLKSTLEFNQMQNSLPNNNENGKKLKI
jgi:hypothetical protein